MTQSADRTVPEKTATAEPEAAMPRAEQGAAIVRRNVYWALGVGIIPVPVVDVVGLVAVELKMIKELSDLYGVQFSDNTATSIVSSLALSLGSVGIAELVGGSLFKLVPALGQLVGVVGVSLLAGAFTQALGNVFVMHFESGGSLLSFEPDSMREYFRKEFEQAKATVAKLRDESAGKAP